MNRASKKFTDFEIMLARTRPDCVVVATTAPTHAQYTSAAAEAGVQLILCEKPMGCLSRSATR